MLLRRNLHGAIRISCAIVIHGEKATSTQCTAWNRLLLNYRDPTTSWSCLIKLFCAASSASSQIKNRKRCLMLRCHCIPSSESAARVTITRWTSSSYPSSAWTRLAWSRIIAARTEPRTMLCSQSQHISTYQILGEILAADPLSYNNTEKPLGDPRSCRKFDVCLFVTPGAFSSDVFLEYFCFWIQAGDEDLKYHASDGLNIFLVCIYV